VTVRIDPAAPAAWARSGATTVLVRSPAGTRRVIRALNAGSERLFAAVVDPADGWQPMQGVERAAATPAGVELRVHASDLSDAQAQALAETIAELLLAAGVREALVTLPEGAPTEPVPAPEHVAEAAEAYAEEAWARAFELLAPPPGARPLTVLDLPGASSLTASYALDADAEGALEHFRAAVRARGCPPPLVEEGPAQPGVARMRSLAFTGPLNGTVTIMETSWPPPWGPVVATVTLDREPPTR
jgi:hypothetical protein